MTTTAAESGTPDASSVEVGAVIHDLMFRQGITKTRMGAAIGVGQPTMGRKLRGLTVITVPELFTIADVLGVSAAEIVQRARRDSNPKPSDSESRRLRLVQGGARQRLTVDRRTVDRPLLVAVAG